MLWGWAGAGQLGHGDATGQCLSASAEGQGVCIDNGLHGVLLSQQEGHKALHAKDLQLSWASVALQPRHQALGVALQDRKTSKEATTTAGPRCFAAGHDAVNSTAPCELSSLCHVGDAVEDRVAETGSLVSDGHRAWSDPEHGLCVAIPTKLVLTCAARGTTKLKVVSCHAAWWHTLLVLAP